MNNNGSDLGYEQIYQERLDETKSMVTLATLFDVLDQGVGDGVNYRSVMKSAYDVAALANPDGIPTQVPDISCVSSVIRSNIKIMIYNIIEFSVTSLIQAIYDRIEDEGCGYVEVSEELRAIWHRTRMRESLNDPSSNHGTAERVSKELLDHAISNTTLHIATRRTVAGGNLDGNRILKLFDEHGVSVHPAMGNYREDALRDIRDRRNDLAHGSISFAEAGGQVTTSELTQLVTHVDSFLTQLRRDVEQYLNSGGYRADKA